MIEHFNYLNGEYVPFKNSAFWDDKMRKDDEGNIPHTSIAELRWAADNIYKKQLEEFLRINRPFVTERDFLTSCKEEVEAEWKKLNRNTWFLNVDIPTLYKGRLNELSNHEKRQVRKLHYKRLDKWARYFILIVNWLYLEDRQHELEKASADLNNDSQAEPKRPHAEVQHTDKLAHTQNYLLPLPTLRQVHYEFDGELWDSVDLDTFYSIFGINENTTYNFTVRRKSDFYALLWSMHNASGSGLTQQEYIKPFLARYKLSFNSFQNIKQVRFDSKNPKDKQLMRRIGNALQ